MGWYRGSYRIGKRSLMERMNESKKDYLFRVRNKDKADATVVAFVFSPHIVKDRRFYSPCKTIYLKYKKYCLENSLKPLSSWQFKKNMQLLGFIYKKSHRFYAGYHRDRVTTAFKNIAFKVHQM